MLCYVMLRYAVLCYVMLCYWRRKRKTRETPANGNGLAVEEHGQNARKHCKLERPASARAAKHCKKQAFLLSAGATTDIPRGTRTGTSQDSPTSATKTHFCKARHSGTWSGAGTRPGRKESGTRREAPWNATKAQFCKAKPAGTGRGARTGQAGRKAASAGKRRRMPQKLVSVRRNLRGPAGEQKRALEEGKWPPPGIAREGHKNAFL